MNRTENGAGVTIGGWAGDDLALFRRDVARVALIEAWWHLRCAEVGQALRRWSEHSIRREGIRLRPAASPTLPRPNLVRLSDGRAGLVRIPLRRRRRGSRYTVIRSRVDSGCRSLAGGALRGAACAVMAAAALGEGGALRCGGAVRWRAV